MTLELKPVTQQEDRQRIQEALAQLEQGQPIQVPATMASFLSDVLRHAQQGDHLTVLTAEQELSTIEAAELLGVSRPFLVGNLLEAGVIPFHYVGSHRRVYARDLTAYQQEKERKLKLLRMLSEEVQELGLE